ncbi:MAG TPA: hypothetical protein VFG09_09485, partial [Thermodesulfovibrionales bacterium]|nr:hypothetical protein [Thermodesulfovibrionales bacterium]
MTDLPEPAPSSHEIASWLLAATALIFVLKMHLLPAVLSGLLVYDVVHLLAPRLRISSLGGDRARAAVVAMLAVIVVVSLILFIWGLIHVSRSEAGSIPVLLKKMAEIVEGSREILPAWLIDFLPGNADDLKEWSVRWLREHAGDLQVVGKEAGRFSAHVLIGMVIGAMVSLREARAAREFRPLASALVERAQRLSQAFRWVVLAQVRIAALNTLFVLLYLAILLPLLGAHLPFVKTMVAITFATGMLPIIGNLISNTIVVVISLSNSPSAAMGSLVFLVVIHKLEYFLNARIVGTQIHARAWEILA